MVQKTKAELLEENERLKLSFENLERRIETISKWIHLKFDPVPAEIKVVLQYKDYDELYSRRKSFQGKKSGQIIQLDERKSSSRELRQSKRKRTSTVVANKSSIDVVVPDASEDCYNGKFENSLDIDPLDSEDEDSDVDFDYGLDRMSDSDYVPESSCETERKEKKPRNEEKMNPLGDVDLKDSKIKAKDGSLEKTQELEMKVVKRKRKNYYKKREKRIKEKDTNTVCHICNKVLATNKSLKHHLKTHSAEKPFLCNECGQSFIAQYYLTCHLRHHVPIEQRKKFTCEICGSVQTNIAGFNRHKRRHAGLECHQCSICGIIFTGRSALRRHIVGVHEKKRPHGCQLCGKQFKTKTHLKTHMKIHEGDKPHRGRALNKDSDDHKPRRRPKQPPPNNDNLGTLTEHCQRFKNVEMGLFTTITEPIQTFFINTS